MTEERKMRTSTRSMIGLALCGLLFLAPEAKALNTETELLLDLLMSKGVISSKEARSFRQTIAERQTKVEPDEDEHYHSVQGITERLEKLEKDKEEFPGLLGGKVKLGGIIELEAGFTRTAEAAGATTNSSDLKLATAELDVDADIAEHVTGHLAILYEEDEENNHLTIDEGIIRLSGEEKIPFYLNAGKMVVPFGRFESHFVSDPITLVLGETNVTSAVVGYNKGPLDLSLGAFNGDIHQTSHDDIINSFVASAVLILPEGTVPDLALTTGVSYSSNLAASNTMKDADGVNGADISNLVGGFAAFLSASYQDRFFLDAEYLGATDDFQAGEVTYSAVARRPRAWNVEMAYGLLPDLEIALRYEGSDEFDNVAPKKQYGAALLYGLFDQTALTLEYLRGEQDNKNDVDIATIQLAVEY